MYVIKMFHMIKYTVNTSHEILGIVLKHINIKSDRNAKINLQSQ